MSPVTKATRFYRGYIPFGPEGAFRPVGGCDELRRLAVRGAAATVSAQGLTFAAQLLSTVVLARLLTPADFGVVTMVTTFSLLLANFGFNGFTEVVIQFEELDHQTASNLFWLNSAAGLFLAIAFFFAGSLLAGFYRNPLATNVAAGVSIGIFIASACVIHLALLKRAMRFTPISTNDIVGRALNTVVSILLAMSGLGYWALVAGILAQQLSVAVGAWWLCRWKPSFPRRTGRTGGMVLFAARVYGQFGALYAKQNIDNLLVGWQFNAMALGLYKKAYDLFALSASQLTAPLNSVALATLSRLNHDPVRFKRYLTTSLGIIAFVGMAVSADLTLVGKDVVRLALGSQWAESGRIFASFGPGIGPLLLYSGVGWIHLSIGTPGRWLLFTLVELAFTAALFLLALPWGPPGIAAAWSISYWTLLIPAFWYAGRPIAFGISPVIACVWKYAVAAVAAGIATTAIMPGSAFRNVPSSTAAALWETIGISALFVLLYLAAVVLLHWGLAPLRHFNSLLRELAPERVLNRPIVESAEPAK